MENILNTIRNIFITIRTSVTNSITTFRGAWNRMNDPAEVRRNEAEFQREDMRRNLGIALVLGCIFAFGTFISGMVFAMELGEVLGFNQGIGYEGNLVELGVVTGMLAYTTAMCGLYRTCLATGRMWHYNEVESRLPRAIRRILITIAVVVAVSAALQRIDGLEQQLPMVAEAADWVIDTFNTQMPKVVEYFKNLFARIIENFPHH